jgi:hypothetical protein
MKRRKKAAEEERKKKPANKKRTKGKDQLAAILRWTGVRRKKGLYSRRGG